MEPPVKRRRLATKDCPECTICSGNVFEVCHPHISTRQSLLDKKNRFGESFCMICRQKHPLVDHTQPFRVVLGSSTLAHLWKTRTFSQNCKYHIDFDCIIGGQIHDVHSSFLDQYFPEHELEQHDSCLNMTSPMDIVLACGVNNILTTDSVQIIIKSYQSFIKSIHKHEKRHKVRNRIVICPILYAPKYCDNRLPPNQNYLHKVFEVNQWIHQFNRQNTGIDIHLDCQGVSFLPTDPSQGVTHNYSQWREPQWQRMLHMGKEAQESAAAQLLQVFESLDHLETIPQTPPQHDLLSSYIVEVEEEEGECK